jgi:hypothetical protein
MDRTLIMVIVLICLPVITVWAMAKAASLRGPASPPEESHEPIEVLVTDKFPYDEQRDEPAHAREQAHHANRPHDV